MEMWKPIIQITTGLYQSIYTVLKDVLVKMKVDDVKVLIMGSNRRDTRSIHSILAGLCHGIVYNTV